MKHWCLLILTSFFLICCQSDDANVVFESEDLIIKKLTEQVYIHTSFLKLDNGQIFPCNGIVYIADGKAVILDTPTNDVSSGTLMHWIEDFKNCKVDHVIVNHFHVDCLGGLKLFHDRGIESFAFHKTIEFAAKENKEVPKNSFDNILISNVGDSEVLTEHPGEAHSLDNTVSYIPEEHVLFGGCMIKSAGAGKGNTTDANLDTWSETIKKVKDKYPQVQIVVPGHGEAGGVELLDYTIELFGK